MTAATSGAWRCTVCGYIHREADPPDWCPVCGAAKADFEPYAEQPAAASRPAPATWRCLNCSYVHAGADPPEVCPVCGAPRDRFEPIPDQAAWAASGTRAVHVVIVGAGIAGISAAEALRRTAPQARITVISKEPHLPYYRLNLTRFLAAEVGADELPIHPESWYAEQGVELRRGREVTAVALDDHLVELLDGERVPFEKLIMAVGAHPFIPPLPGAHRDGVTSLRTTGDAARILERVRDGVRCVCIGGGLLGMETAAALRRRGAEVTLLEGHDWPMPRQLSERAGQLLAERVAAVGIELRTRARAREIVGDERVGGVLLEDNSKTTLPADLVVIATGVRPNSYLARRAGLEVNQGIVVDNHLVSSHPDVLAAGDVAEHRGVLYGAWGPAQYQGNIAGTNAGGGAIEFGGIPRSNTLKVLGLDLLSIGQFEPEDASFEVVEDEADGAYLRFVTHDGRLVGAVLLGDASAGGAVKKAIESGRDLSGLLQRRPTARQVVEHLLQT